MNKNVLKGRKLSSTQFVFWFTIDFNILKTPFLKVHIYFSYNNIDSRVKDGGIVTRESMLLTSMIHNLLYMTALTDATPLRQIINPTTYD